MVGKEVPEPGLIQELCPLGQTGHCPMWQAINQELEIVLLIGWLAMNRTSGASSGSWQARQGSNLRPQVLSPLRSLRLASGDRMLSASRFAIARAQLEIIRETFGHQAMNEQACLFGVGTG